MFTTDDTISDYHGDGMKGHVDRKSEYQQVYRDNVTRLGTPFFHEMDADQKHKNIN